MGPFDEEMLTICSNDSSPLNKMTVLPKYGKHVKVFFFSTKRALRLNLGIQNRGPKVQGAC